MICEEGDMNEDWNDIILNNSSDHDIPNEPSEKVHRMKKLIGTVAESIITSHTSETSLQKVEGADSVQVAESRAGDGFVVYESIGNNAAANDVEKLNNNKTGVESRKGSTPAGLKVDCEDSSQVMNVTSESDGIVHKTMSLVHRSANSISHSKSLSDKVECKRNLKYEVMEGKHELGKSNPVTKTKRSLFSIKKGKPKLNTLKDKVSQDVVRLSAELHKSKKSPKLSLSHHLEAVEEKLNELLDPEGGISKRKDASRGYLKLLFLTAATGNNGHGESIQSNRDLSMILDALLKTKSQTVLVDIINKNGSSLLFVTGCNSTETFLKVQ